MNIKKYIFCLITTCACFSSVPAHAISASIDLKAIRGTSASGHIDSISISKIRSKRFKIKLNKNQYIFPVCIQNHNTVSCSRSTSYYLGGGQFDTEKLTFSFNINNKAAQKVNLISLWLTSKNFARWNGDLIIK